MPKFFAAVVAAACLCALVPATQPAAAETVSVKPTTPPEIIHIITRPLCSELHKHIAPAIGMILENDKNIGRGPDLFSRYNRDALSGIDNSVSNSVGSQRGSMNPSGGMTAGQNMALLGMENLVSPIANNIIATQKILDSPALVHGTGNPEDDAQLKAMREKLLKAVAAQNAALDIISGFVATQQMGDLQHAGQEYISAMNQPDTIQKSGATPSPNPLFVNPNQAGLPANPYDIDLANVPGLTLGYNPVTRLLEALHWTIGETKTQENDAATAVMTAQQLCAGPPPASPKPH